LQYTTASFFAYYFINAASAEGSTLTTVMCSPSLYRGLFIIVTGNVHFDARDAQKSVRRPVFARTCCAPQTSYPDSGGGDRRLGMRIEGGNRFMMEMESEEKGR